MARQPYLTYRMRRNRRRRRIYLAIGIVVGILAVVWIARSNNPDETAAETPHTSAASEPTNTMGPTAADTGEPDEFVVQEPPAAVEPPTPQQPQPEIEPEPEPQPALALAEPAEDDTIANNPQADSLLEQAKETIDSGGIIEAREILNDALMMPMSPQQRREVKTILSQLANRWLFSADVVPNDNLCESYKVQPGDLLTTIANRCKVPYEFLMQINNIARAELLRAGQTIKVANGPFHARVDLSAFRMDVYLQDTYVRSYAVGHGRKGHETPTGLWRVKGDGKLIRPPWPDPAGGIVHPDDPDYPLGSRWIGLDGLEGKAKGRTGFGIHGTKEQETIGERSSEGCIRLFNGDVIQLYNLLVPNYSQVRVEE